MLYQLDATSTFTPEITDNQPINPEGGEKEKISNLLVESLDAVDITNTMEKADNVTTNINLSFNDPNKIEQSKTIDVTCIES